MRIGWIPAFAGMTIALAATCAQADVSGVIRVWGSGEASGLMRQWAEGFRKHHAEISFETALKGDASAMIGLEENAADLVIMTRQIVPYDTYGIWRRSHRMPIEIVVATGSVDAPRKAPALAIFVHADNPIRALTLEQLDGIFGAQRTGGWKGMEWEPAVARGEGGNILTWSQLGLGGEWADKPIHPYGPPATFPGGMSYFQIHVMNGADTRAEAFREYDDPAKMMEAMRADRYGIAYAPLGYRTPQAKPLALAASKGKPAVPLDRESVRTGAYPLSQSVYVYLPPDSPSGDARMPPIDPKVEAFLRYVLSREGQADVARQGDFLPLSEARMREQLGRLR